MCVCVFFFSSERVKENGALSEAIVHMSMAVRVVRRFQVCTSSFDTTLVSLVHPSGLSRHLCRRRTMFFVLYVCKVYVYVLFVLLY